MFRNDKNLVDVDLSHFNTRSLVGTRGMFQNDSQLRTVDLHNWDTRKMQETPDMFMDGPSLVYVNLCGWKVPKLKDSTRMFYHDHNLAGVDLSHFNIHNKEILAEAGNPQGLVVKLGHYKLRKHSGVSVGFKHIQAVGRVTIRHPRGKKYTTKQLFRLYDHSAKRSSLETYVMYNGKKQHFPKGFDLG